MVIEQEICETVKGLFSTLGEKVKLQYFEATLSLQCCKLVRYSNEWAEECMGRPRVRATECEFKEQGKGLKEQLINVINDKTMTAEIIKELTTFKNTNPIKCEQVLLCAKE